MSESSPAFPGGGADDRLPERARSLLFDCIDRLNAGEEIDLAALKREHSDIAEDVIEQLRVFEGLEDDHAALRPTAEGGAGDLGTVGDYTLRRQIGRGGMGVVYEAWENSMDRAVALKVLPAGVAADSRASSRFLREAQAAGKLSHPNVVAVYSMGVTQQTPYYAMEYVEGETLARILERSRNASAEAETPFGKKDCIDYFAKLADAIADVADGLQHAHSRGVVHRDVKPSNLILDAKGSLRILDFGLARLEGQESLTLSGDFVGTPLYMSPEQARRRRIPVDHRTDVYSLGATMYEALCGRPPFRGKDHADTLSQIIEREPPAPRSLNVRLPKELETIVLKCLRKEPADRYGTAEALAQDLRRFVRGDPIEARPMSRGERLRRRLIRRRRSIVLWALVTALAAVCAVFGTIEWRSSVERMNLAYETDVVSEKLRLLRVQLLTDTASGAARTLDQDAFFEPRDIAVLSTGAVLDQAVAALRTLAERYPGRYQAHYELAFGLVPLGQRAEALRHAKRALDLQDGFLPARLIAEQLAGVRSGVEGTRAWLDAHPEAAWQRQWLRAHEAARDGNLGDAAHAYEALLALDDEQQASQGRGLYLGSAIEFRLGHAQARIRQGEPDLAIGDLEILCKDYPSLLEPALLLGLAYHRLGRAEQARHTFEACYARAPSKVEAATWLAVLSISLEEGEAARRWIEELTGEELAALRTKLQTFYAANILEDSERTIEEAKVALRLNPDDVGIMVVLANMMYWKSGFRRRPDPHTLQEVVRLLRRALELRPGLGGARAILGLALLTRGDEKGALEECRRAIRDDPTLGHVVSAASAVFFLTARTDELADYHARIEDSPELTPFSRAHVRAYRGYLRTTEGRFDDAISDYEEAWSIDRQFWYRRNVGQIRYSRGSYREAIDDFRTVITEDPRRHFIDDCYRMIAVCHERLGEPVEAVRVLCEAVRTDPEDLASHDALALRLRRLRGTEHIEVLRDELRGLADTLSVAADEADGNARVDRTCALLRLALADDGSSDEVRTLALRAVEASERKDAEALALLAETELLRRDRGRALEIMEEALRLPDATFAHRALLARMLNEVPTTGDRDDRETSPDSSVAAVAADVGEKDPAERFDPDDVRWLNEQLSENPSTVRINCGGGDHTSASGNFWGRDRFFHGGLPEGGFQKRIVKGANDRELYQAHRSFTPDVAARGYRVPLPPGDYRVTLHLLDEPLADCPEMALDLRVEDSVVRQIEGCEPWVVCFLPAVPRKETRVVHVTDGVLDLEFSAGGYARIAGIEIAPADPD